MTNTLTTHSCWWLTSCLVLLVVSLTVACGDLYMYHRTPPPTHPPTSLTPHPPAEYLCVTLCLDHEIIAIQKLVYMYNYDNHSATGTQPKDSVC